LPLFLHLMAARHIAMIDRKVHTTSFRTILQRQTNSPPARTKWTTYKFLS